MSLLKEYGFTTLELLVVISLTTLLLGISVPATQRLITSFRLQSEARFVAQAIDTFAISAQLRGEKIVLAIRPESFAAYRKVIAGDQITSHLFASGVRASLPSVPLLIGFTGTGVTSPTTLELQLKEHVCKLTVALRGRTHFDCV